MIYTKGIVIFQISNDRQFYDITYLVLIEANREKSDIHILKTKLFRLYKSPK